MGERTTCTKSMWVCKVKHANGPEGGACVSVEQISSGT